MSLDELFGQLVVDPILRKLTRPPDVLEILEEISGLFASNLLRKRAEDKGVISAVS